MRRNLFDEKPYDEINITPLLDLAWTLLVVFIIAVTAAVQGIQVNLPKASTAPSLQEPKTRAITIRDSGQIYLDAYPVSMGELESRLRQFKAVDPNFPVVIKGDAKVYYQKVIDVLDLMQELEITQLGLVTQKLVK
ncbi:MAG: biopolymer transporter ExbD [Thermodesulfobacteriota bacterium]|nr:biopolymer transporter ExbD [Thermodesulfobacteriota bacterium]